MYIDHLEHCMQTGATGSDVARQGLVGLKPPPNKYSPPPNEIKPIIPFGLELMFLLFQYYI